MRTDTPVFRFDAFELDVASAELRRNGVPVKLAPQKMLASSKLVAAMDKAIASKKVTYDFARLMEGATEVKTSEFADGLIAAL